MKKTRDVPQDIEAPVFKLGGAAIGNGFTGRAGSQFLSQFCIFCSVICISCRFILWSFCVIGPEQD